MVKNIFLGTLTVLGKFTSPELDPDPDLAVKIPDPAKGPEYSGSDLIPDPDPQHWAQLKLTRELISPGEEMGYISIGLAVGD